MSASNGTVLLENTIGKRATELIFKSLDVFGNSTLGDACGARICILQNDAGDGSVMKLLAENNRPIDVSEPEPPFHWVGMVCKTAPYPQARRSVLHSELADC